jgi:hypothetical protein
MWSGLYWAKNFFSGLFWGPPSGTIPPVITVRHGGAYPPKKKKKQPALAFWEQRNEDVRDSLMAVVRATEQRKRDAIERQDEEDVIVMMQMAGLL